jgi:protein-tyrosine phosphatase
VPSTPVYTPTIDILLICTANQCRSAMAEGMLRTILSDSGARADIGSAGLLRGGAPATRNAIAVMADRGIDISRHVSRTIDSGSVRSTPLIIGMTREHVREAVVDHGADIARTYTLKELVRRGDATGPRRPDETVFDWLARVAAGRSAADVAGDGHEDDIPDPVGRPRAAYEATAHELDVLLRRLVALMIGEVTRKATYASSSHPGPIGDAGQATGAA